MLDLSSNKIGDEGAKSVSCCMTHLKALTLRNCELTHAGVAALASAAVSIHGKVCYTFKNMLDFTNVVLFAVQHNFNKRAGHGHSFNQK